jgi:type IV pilus assembly protein PilC
MKRFIYKAKDAKGGLVTGEVEASDIDQAAKLVRRKGYFIISISPKREIPFNIFKKFKDRVTGEDLANFTRQLATMINAGLPVTEALLILRSQSRGVMQSIAGQILADVEEGESLSSAVRKHPKAFSPTYVALIKSGEVGGVLDKVLVRLADDLEKEQEFRGKVKSAMIYPIIIVVGMVGVALIMLIFVIPRLTSLYEEFDVDLPIFTKILIAVSGFMARFWPLVLLLMGGVVYGFKIYRSTPGGKKRVDELIFKIPIVGDLQRQIILTDLTRTLSLMTASGVSIIESLTISSEVVGNTVIAEALKDATKIVERGFPIAFAFSKHPEAFPFILSQMVSVGEETGKIDEVLQKVSHVFEVESDQKVKALTSAVEPIILLVLGVGVAFLVVSIILPIYNLTTSL